MSTELKKIIEEDLRKRNITPKSVIQTCINSLNGILFYAKDDLFDHICAPRLIFFVISRRGLVRI